MNPALINLYSDIEICIVDDGSIDSTWEIIQKYQARLDSVVSFRFDKNKGKVEAFNKCFELSSGCYVSLLGADDKNFVERAQQGIDNIGDYDLLFFDLCTFNEKGILEKSLMEHSFSMKSSFDVFFDDLLSKPIVYGGTVFGRRAIFESIFPMDYRLSHEDWWIPLKASSIGKLRYIHSPAIYYRQHDNQTSHKPDSFRNWVVFKTREVFYYQNILDEFSLSVNQKALIEFKLLSQKIIIQESMLKRIPICFQMIKRYVRLFGDISFEKKKTLKKLFLSTINPKLVAPRCFWFD